MWCVLDDVPMTSFVGRPQDIVDEVVEVLELVIMPPVQEPCILMPTLHHLKEDLMKFRQDAIGVDLVDLEACVLHSLVHSATVVLQLMFGKSHLSCSPQSCTRQ
mgnify:CR=1 FL=1